MGRAGPRSARATQEKRPNEEAKPGALGRWRDGSNGSSDTSCCGGFFQLKKTPQGNQSNGPNPNCPFRARSYLLLSPRPGWRSARWSPMSSRGPGWPRRPGSWWRRLLGPWAGPAACSGHAALGHRCGGASPSPCAGRRSRSTGRCCSRCMSRWLCDRSSSSSARPKRPRFNPELVPRSCRTGLTQLWRGWCFPFWPRFSNSKMNSPLTAAISQPFAKGNL